MRMKIYDLQAGCVSLMSHEISYAIAYLFLAFRVIYMSKAT